MPDDTLPWIPLRSALLSAQINPIGAQLSILRDRHGNDLLWHGDAAFWAGRAPVLFPIVGTLAGGNYRLGNDRYALSRHGFARGKTFETVSATVSNARFRLRADESTKAVYPFRFALELDFALEGAKLTVTASVRNEGDTPMPASIGFHPGFRWPLPYGHDRASHAIRFEQDEPGNVYRINGDGLLAQPPQATPVVDRRLALVDDLFRNDVLILEQPRSKSLRYGAEGGPQLEIGFPDSTWLGLWTRPGAPFICIEPWQGVTDPAGFAGDFRDKPGVFQVAPGASHSMVMTVAWIDTRPTT